MEKSLIDTENAHLNSNPENPDKMKKHFSKEATNAEKIPAFFAAFILSPLPAALFCFFCFHILGIEDSETLRYFSLIFSLILLYIVYTNTYDREGK